MVHQLLTNLIVAERSSGNVTRQRARAQRLANRDSQPENVLLAVSLYADSRAERLRDTRNTHLPLIESLNLKICEFPLSIILGQTLQTLAINAIRKPRPMTKPNDVVAIVVIFLVVGAFVAFWFILRQARAAIDYDEDEDEEVDGSDDNDGDDDDGGPSPIIPVFTPEIERPVALAPRVRFAEPTAEDIPSP
ncbi:hypothetical protein F5Y01DRAFT_315233 [Xylaria sp. FL0043]|nr:hypothetical protein F5Y01DRAFT_315233 [Xylaria sp. FL0043]